MTTRPLIPFGTAFWAIVWLASLSSHAGTQERSSGQPPAPPATQYESVVRQYCQPCHNERVKTAGFSLEHVDTGDVAAAGEAWEKVVLKLRRQAMPPQGSPRPDDQTYQGLTAWLEGELDRAAASHPDPGRPLPHRLNRAEYRNAIRDLLALDIGDVAALLPSDDSAYGFDNIAEALGVSSVLLERYVSAAGRISALAVGDPDAATGSETWVLRQDYSQDRHVDGQPFGTVGGLVREYTFPLDAEYELAATLMRTNVDAPRGLEEPHQVEFTLDGARVFITSIGGTSQGINTDEEGNRNTLARPDAVDAQLKVRIPVPAGPHTVGVDFVQRSLAAGTRKLQPFRSSFDPYDATGMPHIRTLSVTGPFNATGPGDTPSRRRIFSCQPSSAAGEEPCAAEILSTLARRAYRQPPTPDDMERLLAFYRVGRRDGGFERGIQRALHRLLASPKFVIRVERPPDGVDPGVVYPLTDDDLASRLSFFLWSSIPDDELLTVAERGGLQAPDVFETQVRRMLADPKAYALVSNFAGQWLQLRNLRNSVPNEDLFPTFDDNLRQAFQRETELFFESIIREDRSVVDLLTADYTFVDERLARHYGIPHVYGSHFRRVPVAEDARRGLFGHGSILTSTSNANRTSPVVRGKWILANLLGMPPSSPPPDVPPLEEDEPGARVLTMRQQMDAHRKAPVCASCHKLMDPLGFAMENFDAVGAWRTRDAAGRIDASGQFLDGTALDGITGLRQAVASRPEVFVGTLTEKLLTYALGRGIDDRDMPAVRTILRNAARDDYRFSSLVVGIVTSTPFLKGIAPVEPLERPPAGTAARGPS